MLPDASVDRVVATYVLDLLSCADIRVLVDVAARALTADGLLCLAGLTHGTTRLSRAVASIWQRVHRLAPTLVGGCRPLDCAGILERCRWTVVYREVVVSWGVPSEVVTARPPPADAHTQ